MKFSSPQIIFFILLIQQTLMFSSIADKQFIENTCKNTPSYNLCLEILLADPDSQNADMTGLALIGVAAVNTKSVNILQQVDDLKNSQPDLKPALDYCTEVYNAVVDADVPSANDALRGGMVKFAEDGMADAAVESQACERSFGKNGLKSPITGLNNEMNDVANVVRAIIRNLL